MSSAPTHISMIDARSQQLGKIHGEMEHQPRPPAPSDCNVYLLLQVYQNPQHLLHTRLPEPKTNVRCTHTALSMNSRAIKGQHY